MELVKLKRDWKQLNDTNGVYLARDNWLKHLSTISENEIKLNELRNQIAETGCAKEEQEELVSSYKKQEQELGMQARKLMVACSENTQDLEKLHTKKEELAKIESSNFEVKEGFKGDFAKAVEEVSAGVEEWRAVQVSGLNKVGNQVEQELAKRQAVLERIATTVDQLSACMDMGLSGETSSIADVRNAITQANVGIVAATDKGRSKIEKVGDGAQVNIQELVLTLAKEVTHQS